MTQRIIVDRNGIFWVKYSFGWQRIDDEPDTANTETLHYLYQIMDLHGPIYRPTLGELVTYDDAVKDLESYNQRKLDEPD